jgi:TonB-dependent starch-binding outer membrane protein SusC
MEKFQDYYGRCSVGLLSKKTIRVMKLSFFLYLVAIIQLWAADSYSQFAELSVKLNDVKISDALKVIEDQSDFYFMYSPRMIDVDRKVSIDENNEPINVILTDIFGDDVRYAVYEKQIILMPNEQSDLITAIQQHVVSGLVTDGTSGAPMPGVTVIIAGTLTGTQTDAQGRYSISVPDQNAVLQFSFVGFVPQTAAVGSKNRIDVVMAVDTKSLSEIVVVGYGTQTKKDVTGAITSISTQDLENRPSTQFGNALEGKAAGVQVIRASGQPQAGFSIKVRGTSSITSGSDPLYIVDGVQTYSISEINPADIESFSVLKDASSAAIYGSSGANGVVLITTKHGGNHATKVSFNASLMSSQVWKKLPVLNSSQFQELATELGLSTDWNYYNADTDWQNIIFRNALTQNYQLSLAGGDAKTDYYLSGSWIDQEGIILNNSLNRATFKVNLNHTVNKVLKVGTNISYDRWSDVSVPENDRNGIITRLITSVPIIGIWDKTYPDQYALNPFIPDLENPYSTVYQPEQLYVNNRLHGNVFGEINIVKGLKFKSLLGFEHSNGIYTSFQNPTQTRYGRSMDGLAAENDDEFTYWISENTLNYTHSFGDHSIAVLGGFIASRENAHSIYTSSHGFGNSTAITTVTAGTVQSVPQVSIYEKSHAAFIARLNYAYKDRYLLTSNFRADGSGQFASGNRWGYFPSFSAGWRISKEAFFSNVTGISDLKLRFGWGIVGNDKADPYAWYGLVSPSAYIIGGSVVNAYVPNTLENVNLKWEKTSQANIGIDLALLRDRIVITADYYDKTTKDLLLYVPQPLSTGYSTALQNAGSLRNRGFEFQISSKNFINEGFTWNTDFNIYFNKGEVLDIVGTTMHTGPINPAGTTYNLAYVEAGLPLGSFYGKFAQGVNPTTGDVMFLQNEAGEDSLGVIGNANPKFTYGLTNSFTWKGFQLDFFIQGVQGNQIFNATRILTESMRLGMNQSATVLNRWKNPGDVTDMPRAIKNDETNCYPSTRYIEDGSYLRIKSLTLGYNIPQSALDKIRFSRILVYVTAENLLTVTRYSGFDPEVSAFGSTSQDNTSKNTAPGVDYGTYPQSRDFLFGISVTF